MRRQVDDYLQQEWRGWRVGFPTYSGTLTPGCDWAEPPAHSNKDAGHDPGPGPVLGCRDRFQYAAY